MIELHNALFGELVGGDLSPLAGLFTMAPNKVVGFGGNQIIERGETAEGIALTMSKKCYGTGTGGLVYAEDEWARNPTTAKGMNWGIAKRGYLIGAMRAARAGKKVGLYHLPYTNIDQRHASETEFLNNAARELIACCEVAMPDLYMPAWDVDADFYASNVPGALAEACRIPNELGIPTMPFVQLWTANAERDLTDNELAAIGPRQLAAAGCAGVVLWGWAAPGTAGIVDRFNACVRRAAKVWA